MEDTTQLVVRLEGDDETGRGTLTVEGDSRVLSAIVVLIAAAFSTDEGDCGDPDCPVHGDGVAEDGDIAESA